MKKSRIVTFLLALILLPGLVASLPVRAIERMEVQARHAILVDAAYGEVLYEQAAREKAYPASITKVMTALLVVEAVERGELSLAQMVTASVTSQEGLASDGSTQDIRPGESLSVKDLLYCLMLPSANEAANILAEAAAGDIPSFVAAMNRRVAELGCESTHFTNAHGLPNENHYTTAFDIALFFAKAMEYPLFQEIVATAVYETAPTERKGPRLFYNTNPLISPWLYTNYVYAPCIGGKTGTTGQAGGCLVSAARAEDEYLIAVVLGADTLTLPDGSRNRLQYSESSRLFQWGFSGFSRQTISPGDAPVARVEVKLSRQADEVLLRPVGSIQRTLPVDLDHGEIRSEVRLFSDSVQAPVEEGQLMGTLTLFYRDEEYGTLDLVALNEVERSEFLYRKLLVEEFFQANGMKLILGTVLVLALLVLLRAVFFRRRRRARTGAAPGGGGGNPRYRSRRR